MGKYCNKIIMFLCIILIGICNTFSQDTNRISANSLKQIEKEISYRDTIIQLDDKYLIPSSIKVRINTTFLILNEDYIFDNQKNQIRLLSNQIEKLSSDKKVYQLKIVYQVLPFDFKSKYSHREIVYRQDTVTKRNIIAAKPVAPFSVENIFGDNIQKSGSITRGFSFGTNRDLSLNSGFRMQLSGKLSEDIDIAAALTDENTPIQPEGNTQTLQEIDKVFIELKSKNIAATLGDFNFDVTGNEFGRISRKLQGGLGTAKYNLGFANGNITGSGAITRGKYNSNRFTGVEGVQGPYRLTGKNNERNIIIIAGSEKIYIDGELMKRGEEYDYVIDYAIAEVTFTSRRLINGNSRIEIDFEYTDRQYTRNFYAVSGNSNLFNDKTSISASFYREGDDYDNPIDLTLSDTDRQLLREAGDERIKASQDGALLVEKGKGQYIKIDTLINSTPESIYRYVPGDSNANYTVTFTYVGDGKGDYIKNNIGNYQFIGKNLGSYLPVRFLPLPQLHSLVDVDIKSQVTDYFKITGEAAVSNLDVNRFSGIDDSDNQGGAFKFSMQLNPKEVKVGNANIGSFDLQIKQRLINNNFNSIDRINDIEFDRKWNILQDYRTNESISEGLLFYQPINSMKIGTGYGRILRGDKFSSNRVEGYLNFTEVTLPKLSYKFELINSKENEVDALGKWFRQLGNLEYTKGYFTPGIKFESENRDIKSIVMDTLKIGSFRFYEVSPKLAISRLYNTNIGVEYKWRVDDKYFNRGIIKESNTFTQIYSISTRPISNLSSNVDVTLRKREYTKEFKTIAGGNSETILIRWLTRYSAFNRGLESDLFYDASTQRSAKFERVFQRVQKGTGSYVYIGDIDSNGIATEDEFRPTRFDGDYIILTIPSDKLSPVIDLKLNARLKLTPSRFLSDEKFVGKMLSAVSSETYAKIEEKSSESDQKKIYLLNLKNFLNENTTIAGNIGITQDIFLFEQNSSLSLRFRFQQRNGLIQYALGTERSYQRERSIRIRWQLIKEIANQTDYENKRDQVSASSENYRVRNINGNFITSDWTYRPERSIELGFKIGVGRSENRLPSLLTNADLNLQGMRLVYSIVDRGLCRLEFNREEVSLSGSKNNLPFELTGGRLEGKTWLWRLGLEYRFTNFIQAAVNYDGRKESNLKIVHTMRGEVRAFF